MGRGLWLADGNNYERLGGVCTSPTEAIEVGSVDGSPMGIAAERLERVCALPAVAIVDGLVEVSGSPGGAAVDGMTNTHVSTIEVGFYRAEGYMGLLAGKISLEKRCDFNFPCRDIYSEQYITNTTETMATIEGVNACLSPYFNIVDSRINIYMNFNAIHRVGSVVFVHVDDHVAAGIGGKNEESRCLDQVDLVVNALACK